MSNQKTAILAGIGSLLVAMLSLTAAAQNAPNPPRLANQPLPPQVTNAVGKPVAGWAIVRYSVLENGTTDHARVVATAPPAADDDAVLAAFAQWEFTPASADGERIDWHNNESVVLFAEPVTSAESHEQFLERLSELSDSIGDIDHLDADFDDEDELRDMVQARAEGAAARNWILLNEMATRRDDIGLALIQSAFIELSRGDYAAALSPLQLATRPEVAAVGPADLYLALEFQIQVEERLGRSLEALATFDRLAAGYGPDDTNPYTFNAEAINEAVANSEFLPVAGRIDEGPWSIELGREFFYFDNIDGNITTLTTECDRRRLEIEFRADVDYRVPESFGSCTVVVDGDPGTSFTFVEVLPQEN